MRTVKFQDMIREAAQLQRRADSELWFPEGTRTQRTWPICMSCKAEVEAAELKNFTMTSVEIWARCHGKEDYYKVFFPFRIDGDPVKDERANWAIKRALHDGIFFDPRHSENTQSSLIVMPKTPKLSAGRGIIL